MRVGGAVPVQGAPAGVGGTQLTKSQQERGRVVELFDGRTLDGWHAVPRLPVAAWPGGPAPDPGSPEYLASASSVGAWSVQDGAIVGTQNPPGSGLGGYLLTDDRYGDFQLTYEVRPDWPADTGVLVRASDLGAQGFQVLIDHRRSGGIGGFYGNGIGGFHALAYGVDVARDESGRPVGLVEDDPATTLEPVTDAKRALLSYAAPGRGESPRVRRGRSRALPAPSRRHIVRSLRTILQVRTAKASPTTTRVDRPAVSAGEFRHRG